MDEVFAELKTLIDYIQTVYSQMTYEWLNSIPNKINLKKTYVSDIKEEGSIYQTIIMYVQLLNERSMELILQLSSICTLKLTARVKTQNSIEYKIYNYKTKHHESGKVPINKCMNDLFGVRIILDIPVTYEEVHSFVQTNYGSRYRCIDSSKGDYKAIHLYFKDGNQAFPWELQIWNQCDSINNFKSHKEYKQGYTTWEKESKEGGIINGQTLHYNE